MHIQGKFQRLINSSCYRKIDRKRNVFLYSLKMSMTNPLINISEFCSTFYDIVFNCKLIKKVVLSFPHKKKTFFVSSLENGQEYKCF